MNTCAGCKYFGVPVPGTKEWNFCDAFKRSPGDVYVKSKWEHSCFEPKVAVEEADKTEG